MKDFYDVYTILNTNQVDKTTLKMAIQNTFERRSAKPTKNHSLFTIEFYENENRNLQWLAFQKKSKLNPDLMFSTVLKFIKKELEEIYWSLSK